MQTLHIHHRQSILLGLALTELTIPLKITPRSSYTSLLNQDGYVLYYKIFSFPPPAWLPHSLSIDYNLATWKHPESNYLAAIQDIHRNCSFLRQGVCAWEWGRHEHRAGEPGQALPQPLLYFWLASWFLWVLQPTWRFGRGPVFLSSYLLPLGLMFFAPRALADDVLCRWCQDLHSSALGKPCGVVGAHHLCRHMVTILLNHILMKKGKLGHSLCFH